jgi:hypothetical protein
LQLQQRHHREDQQQLLQLKQQRQKRLEHFKLQQQHQYEVSPLFATVFSAAINSREDLNGSNRLWERTFENFQEPPNPIIVFKNGPLKNDDKHPDYEDKHQHF